MVEAASNNPYQPKGFDPDSLGAYNHRTATPNEDGSYTFHFNAAGQPNNMRTVDGWNMVVRLYRPSSFEAIMAYLGELERDKVQIEPIAGA